MAAPLPEGLEMFSHLMRILPFFGVRLPYLQEFLFDSLLLLKIATRHRKKRTGPFFQGLSLFF
jgi:hypothetical protein